SVDNRVDCTRLHASRLPTETPRRLRAVRVHFLLRGFQTRVSPLRGAIKDGWQRVTRRGASTARDREADKGSDAFDGGARARRGVGEAEALLEIAKADLDGPAHRLIGVENGETRVSA